MEQPVFMIVMLAADFFKYKKKYLLAKKDKKTR